ncbi:hypothetical protein FPRO05_14206 [Fusarium proliferatum]|uniref:BZIP domain-containing protein n=1 Tax=Gibberella intermedia TaxID=948311 RepID=A0A365MTT7_GIBIN|nr:hypothetical protein FPRO05_14206 [Fusarium proliferatum]
MTPCQFQRKREKDREAQRSIRARTKDHMLRLEAELADLKNSGSGSGSDGIKRELRQKNQILEEEATRLNRAVFGLLRFNVQYGGIIPLACVASPHHHFMSLSSVHRALAGARHFHRSFIVSNKNARPARNLPQKPSFIVMAVFRPPRIHGGGNGGHERRRTGPTIGGLLGWTVSFFPECVEWEKLRQLRRLRPRSPARSPRMDHCPVGRVKEVPDAY